MSKPIPGTISTLFNQLKNDPLYKNPWVQILTINKIDSKSKNHCYKVYISDGKHKMRSIFAAKASRMIEKKELGINCLVQLGDVVYRQKDSSSYLLTNTILDVLNRDTVIGSPTVISGEKNVSPNLSNDVPQDQIKRRKSEDSSDNGRVLFIKDLNPLLNKWEIKGRVVSRSDIKMFNTKNGPGKLFSFQIVDKTMQCKVVAFGEAVDLFYPLISVESVYRILKGTIRVTNPQYASNGFSYEIHIDKNSIVALENDEDIPKQLYNFIAINKLGYKINGIVDVLGIVSNCFPVSTITVKSTGKEIQKRDIYISDKSGESTRLTLWGTKAEDEYPKGTVVCCTSVKVNEYNGINLNAGSMSSIIKDADLKEAADLLAWYEIEGKNIVVTKRTDSFTNKKFISEFKEEGIDFTFVIGTLTYMKEENMYYSSCPGENCNKKIIPEENGNYKCEKCDYIYDHCDYRYLLNVTISDCSDQIWATLFNQSGEKLFNKPASEFVNLNEEDSSASLATIKSKLYKEYAFKLKVKEEIVKDEPVKRYHVFDVKPIDYAKETENLLKEIEAI